MKRKPSAAPAPFAAYCEQVCALVRSSHDHAQITAELIAHMEDRRDAYLRAGFSAKEAEKRAVAAMGDPAEVGKAMDKAHPMGWDVLLSLSRTALAVSLILLLLSPFVSLINALDNAASRAEQEKPQFSSHWMVGQVIPVDERVTLYLNKATITGDYDGALRYFQIRLEGYYLFDGQRITFNQWYLLDYFTTMTDDLGNQKQLTHLGNLDRGASVVYRDFDNGMRSYHAEIPLDWGDIPYDD